MPFHSSLTSLDTACAATVALIILSVLRRNRSRKAFRAAFGRAQKVFSITPRFVGHLSTLVHSTPRCFRAEPTEPLAADAFDPSSPQASPHARRPQRASTTRFCSGKAMLPIQRRAKTASAKLLSSLKLDVEDLETESSETEWSSEQLRLGELFDSLTSGVADVKAMQLAAIELKAYGLELQARDGQRLYDMLSDGQGVVKERFVSGLSELLVAARQVEQQALSLPQLRVVLQSAFERLDADQNGAISVEEFLLALRHFKVQLERRQAEVLLRFLGGHKGVEREHLERQVMDKAHTALQGAKQRLAESTGRLFGSVDLCEHDAGRSCPTRYKVITLYDFIICNMAI